MNTFRKKMLAGLFVALPFGFAATAQTGTTENKLFLASASSAHPNERPQWSKEQAEAWFKKVGPIKGINHPTPPCNAVSQDEALSLARQSGYNSVRWFLGGGNAADYIRSVENAAAAAWKYGMTISPVFSFAHVPTSTSDSLNLESMVRQIIRQFRNDERIIMWDLWNEPAMYDTQTPKIMETIRLMAQWCREEGCTQAISSSIVWDSGNGNTTGGQYGTQRDAAEAEMDVHNFHDYGMQEGHSANVGIIVNRLKKISDRPIICTEVLTRPNGSGMAVSLRECAKYNIGFYSWGLYSCDSNWDVTWHTSTYYAYEPMFHCIYYAGGDPVDRREEDYVRNFKYTSEQIYPGAEETERWTERRAWKWMVGDEQKMYRASSISDANSFISAHGNDGAYNCIAVRLSYADYVSAGSSSYLNSISSLATKANNAGMRLLPILFTSEDLSVTRTNLANYAYSVINKFYNDRKYEGWCVFEQTQNTEPSNFKTVFSYIFNFIRYTFPNQPMFAAPMISTATQADSTATDYTNYLWQLSDVISFTTENNSEVTTAQLGNMLSQYNRPLFFMSSAKIQDAFADYHVNFATPEVLSADEVKAFKFRPLNITKAGDCNKMPSWKAWAQMNHGSVKGLYYPTPALALKGIPQMGAKGFYNSVAVLMNFDTYNRTPETYLNEFNAILDSAEKYNMTVVPILLNDAYAKRNATALNNYVAYMIETYNNDPRIFAWELYNRAGARTSLTSTLTSLIPQLFTSARSKSPNRPVFVTPSVSTNVMPDGYNYTYPLEHYAGGAGWEAYSDGKGGLNYGNSNINVVYMCWQLSDIVSINTSQNNPEIGWLNSVAYRFGRPQICTCWETAKSTTIDATLDIFSDHKEAWYVYGSLDDSKVENFKYRPIITNH